MPVSINASGQNYSKLDNSWNDKKFMKTYDMVNNPTYPFVFGNPSEYGSNTNPDPFFWGSDRNDKNCGCVTSMKTSEGMCSSCGNCGNTNVTYNERDLSNVQPMNNPANVDHKNADPNNPTLNNASLNYSIALSSGAGSATGLGSTTANQPHNDITVLNDSAKHQQKTLRTLQITAQAKQCIDNPGACMPHTFDESYEPKYQLFGSDTTQHTPHQQEHRAGHSNVQSTHVTDGTNHVKNAGYCASTRGGKTLAF